MEPVQGRMFRLAIDALDISAFYEHRIGWHLSIRMRRGDESWGDVQPELYDRLSTDELADVIATSVAEQLGLV